MHRECTQAVLILLIFQFLFKCTLCYSTFGRFPSDAIYVESRLEADKLCVGQQGQNAEGCHSTV